MEEKDACDRVDKLKNYPKDNVSLVLKNFTSIGIIQWYTNAVLLNIPVKFLIAITVKRIYIIPKRTSQVTIMASLDWGGAKGSRVELSWSEISSVSD